jgi:ribosomal protein S18 acetylase RimI-like enzyme
MNGPPPRLELRPINASDIPAVSSVHDRIFGSDSGRRFLEKAFYPTMLHPDSTGFGYLISQDAKTAGFISGARSASAWHRTLVRRHGADCLWPAARMAVSGRGPAAGLLRGLRFLALGPSYESGGLIFFLGIDDAFRGRGLAPRLVEAFLEHCRSLGLSCCWTRARQANVQAQKLYLRLGFRVHPEMTKLEKNRAVFRFDLAPPAEP